MRYNQLIIVLLAAVVAMGCSRDDAPEISMPYEPSGDAISFGGSPDNWGTKGVAYGNSNLAEMDIYAYYTAQNEWADVTSASDMSRFMSNQLVTKSDDGVWSYSPIKYWPNNSGDKLSFFAFVPHGAVGCRYDNVTGEPKFTYVMSPYASENDELLLAQPQLDRTKPSSATKVTFDFEHVLTRLTLEGAIINKPTVAQSLADYEANVRYYISGVTLFNINSTANVVYNNGVWKLNNKRDPFKYTAMHGTSLLPYGAEAELEATAKDVMLDDDTGIFVLPQDVSSATLQVRVCKVFDRLDKDGNVVEEDCEIVYATSDQVAIPTPDSRGWVAGDWVNMTFTFNAGELSEYETPMTVSSKVHKWTMTGVDASIHRNMYTYSSKREIEVQDDVVNNQKYGEFMICTNYTYDLRVPHHRHELDGAMSLSCGFMFCSDDFNGYSTNDIDTVKGNYKVFVPTLLTGKGGREVEYVTRENLAASGKTYSEPIEYSEEGFAFVQNPVTTRYDLLYYDPFNGGAITPFDYTYDPVTGYHEIDLSKFESDSTIYFEIVIGDLGGSEDYSFLFSVKRSDREAEDLYVSTAIDDAGTDNAYGVNKMAGDPVYILRLSVDAQHLANQGGVFDDVIGVDMLSNGGGKIQQLFDVLLTDN